MKQCISLITQERIEHKIFIISGKKVMLDKDLAELYGVNEANKDTHTAEACVTRL